MKQILITLLKETKHLKRLTNVSKLGNKWEDMYIELLNYTKFLPDDVSTRERLYYVEHELEKMVMCSMCDNKATWYVHGPKIYTYGKYCFDCAVNSPEAQRARQNTMQQKYGVNHNWSHGELRQSGLRTCVIKHGTLEEIKNIDTISSNFQLEKVKTKTQVSLITNNNGIHPFSDENIRTKNIETSVKRYGSTLEKKNIKNITSVSQMDNIKNKINTKLDEVDASGISLRTHMRNNTRKTKLNNFYDKLVEAYSEYDFITTKQEYIESKSSNITYKHKCGSINTSHIQHIRCSACYSGKSTAEVELVNFCKRFTSNIKSNTRKVIPPQELDIYLPSYNIAIEYDGLYWHSSNTLETEDKQYHIRKTLSCKEMGISLLHIFEHEWQDEIKQKIWKSILLNKFRKCSIVRARNCSIKMVQTKEKDLFLLKNHLQGPIASSVNLGLFYDNTLISIMTFGKSRYKGNKKYNWELLRFCNKVNTSVTGGASKLFKFFIKHYSGIIVSYADLRWSKGDMYIDLGFKYSHSSLPNYWYWKPASKLQLYSRIQFQKHKLKNKLSIFDSTLSESQNMYNNGYRKIFDCGNQVYIYTPPTII